MRRYDGKTPPDDILMWCGQDIQGAVKMNKDRDNWRRFLASPFGPCWPLDLKRRRRRMAKAPTWHSIILTSTAWLMSDTPENRFVDLQSVASSDEYRRICRQARNQAFISEEWVDGSTSKASSGWIKRDLTLPIKVWFFFHWNATLWCIFIRRETKLKSNPCFVYRCKYWGFVELFQILTGPALSLMSPFWLSASLAM